MRYATSIKYFELDYVLPMKDKLLVHYTSIEKLLVIINVILFAASF